MARGEVGQVWKLTSDTTEWAIKEAFEQPNPTEAKLDACYQEAGCQRATGSAQSTGGSLPNPERVVTVREDSYTIR